MTKSKRTRELAQRKAERQAARRADRRRRKQQITAIVVAAALVIGGVAFFIVNRPAPELQWTTAPGVDTQVTSLTFNTNRGDIVIETRTDDAPQTVGSMAFLADQGFFDGTTCHRVTTDGIYVLQCGDPSGDGTGGPGYTVPDENLPAEGEANYPAGTVAMANAGPGTSGSQFFLVYQDTTLPPGYSIWGTITEGLDLVAEIAADGTADGSPDGEPATPIVIESASATRL